MSRVRCTVAYVLFLGILGCVGVINGLGVNWGTIASHPLPPEIVVQLMKDNGINKVKLFDTDKTVLNALAGSGIEVMVALPNVYLANMASPDKAKAWVKQNVTSYLGPKGVNITYVAIGNEPFLQGYNGSFVNVTFPALKNVQNALNDAGVGNKIKATVPCNADVYYSPWNNPVPSGGIFRPDIASEMKKIVDFQDKNGAPFIVNIYPFISLYLSDGAFPTDYAFFDGMSNPVKDNGRTYTNMFEANYDTLVAALDGVGHGNMTIMVGEMGWPTDGDVNANTKNAQKFYGGLLKNLGSKKGTPRRPGIDIEVYLFGLIDEDAKSLLPGTFERHWGIFSYDGQPKFPIDFSGQGKNKSAVPAKNVTYLPNSWCMLNPKAGDLSKLDDQIKAACEDADCTPLGFGSSCNGLDAAGNASYAFNAYYQLNYQTNCDFGGLGLVTKKNISQGTCKFNIQVDSHPASEAPAPAPAPAQVPASAPKKKGYKEPKSTSSSSAGSSMAPFTFFSALAFGAVLDLVLYL
ncbi:hypothetical protein RJ640_029260 [Escallonia rubra]|uniref:glucan endo-1,3-beta-D-glucosidase n=1 Tax=Escallonia rubra TaxID=112253 RepID=A0AA88R6G8_9ASTE|nr:hypothetical protein RJ640_029260 [Escallonia rubra]